MALKNPKRNTETLKNPWTSLAGTEVASEFEQAVKWEICNQGAFELAKQGAGQDQKDTEKLHIGFQGKGSLGGFGWGEDAG